MTTLIPNSSGRALAKKGLEPTLPWQVKLVFENLKGEEIMFHYPGLIIRNWDDRIEIEFCPDRDISIE